jgi:hypothetical protein
MSVLLLAGCGPDNESAILYMLFDSSPSSSTLVREGYRENALLVGQSFCGRYKGGGEIVLDVITAYPEQDSVFRTLACPSGRNETDEAAKLITFKATLETAVDEIVPMQSSRIGTDVAGAIVYGASQTFARLKPDDKYLVVYSDMQQSGGGMQECVQQEGADAASRCLRLYFAANPQYPQSGALDGARRSSCPVWVTRRPGE